MKIKTAVWAALLLATTTVNHALATELSSLEPRQTENAMAMGEYGDTLPPVGYVKFCAAFPDDCRSYTESQLEQSGRLSMTPALWNTLYKVNAFVNHKIKPMTDMELYGEAERWTYPTTAGDCEDYLLLKKKKLQTLGLPPRALRITVVLDEHGEGHAVLTATTEDGDYMLDNRRDDILLWNDTHYTFLKRQSEKDPRKWVALLKKPEVRSVAVGSGKAN